MADATPEVRISGAAEAGHTARPPRPSDDVWSTFDGSVETTIVSTFAAGSRASSLAPAAGTMARAIGSTSKNAVATAGNLFSPKGVFLPLLAKTCIEV